MADDFYTQVERIRAKAMVVAEKYTSLKKAYDILKNDTDRLRAELLARDKEIEQLKMKVEHFSIASTVKVSNGDIESTRALVADLIREIDRCIADLND